MKASVETRDNQNYLVITLPIEPSRSKSGKSIVVASTRGNQPSTAMVNGKQVTIGVNAYIKD